MKQKQKKILRSFRLSPDVWSELSRRSEATGIPETRIVEDALRFHFASNMQKVLARTLAQMRAIDTDPKIGRASLSIANLVPI